MTALTGEVEAFAEICVEAFDGIAALVPEGALRSFLVDGVVNGLGSSFVFVPQIALLIAFVTIVEATGYMARAVFPEKANEFKLVVDLVAEMSVYNPFDFFLEESAQIYPFAYDAGLKKELAPFMELPEPTPKLVAIQGRQELPRSMCWSTSRTTSAISAS